MRKILIDRKRLFTLFVPVLFIFSCNRQTEVPFSENEFGYEFPETKPFQMPEPKSFEWKEIHPDSVNVSKVSFDIEKLPCILFSLNVDNRSGIPESVKAKIFLPFFTTIPIATGTTGQRTGLWWSFNIVKAHGVEISVESNEGEGLPNRQVNLPDGQVGLPADRQETEFIIQLPISE